VVLAGNPTPEREKKFEKEGGKRLRRLAKLRIEKKRLNFRASERKE